MKIIATLFVLTVIASSASATVLSHRHQFVTKRGHADASPSQSVTNAASDASAQNAHNVTPKAHH